MRNGTIKLLIPVILLFLVVLTVSAATDEQLQYYWTFNETLLDNIGGETFTTSSNVNYTGGQMNSSLQSEGSGYVENSNFPNIQWNNYTLGFFMYIASKPGAEGYYFDLASTTPDKKIYIRQEATNEFLFTHYTPASVSITLQAADYDTGKWYHFAMLYDNTNLCLYKDGKKYSCSADTGTLANLGATPELIVLGNIDTDSFAPASTKIDDLRIYDRNLTVTELLEWNNTQRPGEQPLTVRAYNIFNNSVINSFAADINGTNYSTDTGVIETTIDNVAKIINITVFNATSYKDQTLYNTTASGSKNFYLYPTTYFNFTFKDEETDALLNNYNVTVEVIGNYNIYNTTTDTGNYFVQLVTPDNYTIRFDSLPQYSRRTYDLEVKTVDNKSITLYLLNDSKTSDVVLTLIDQNLEVVEGATIQIYRYKPSLNQYVQIEGLTSNFEGQAVAHLVLNDEWYKFRVLYEGSEVLYTSPTIIIDTSLTLQISTETPFGLDYGVYRNVNFNLTYNNATKTVDFTYYDPSNSVTEACLKVYKISGSNKAINGTSCLEASSGTILLSGYNFSQNFFTASALIDLPNEDDVVLSSITFGEYEKIGGANAIIYYIFVQLAFLFGFAVNPIVGLLMFPIPMWGAWIMHFIHFPISIAAGTTVICLIVCWLLWDKKG